MTPLSVLGLTYVCLSISLFFLSFFLSLSLFFSFRSDCIELDFKDISYLVKFVVKFILFFVILLNVEVQKKRKNKFDNKLNICKRGRVRFTAKVCSEKWIRCNCIIFFCIRFWHLLEQQ